MKILGCFWVKAKRLSHVTSPLRGRTTTGDRCMSRTCLHCGRKLGFLKRTGDQFCSSEHDELYHQERVKMAFHRLMGIGTQPPPSDEITETPRMSESIQEMGPTPSRPLEFLPDPSNHLPEAPDPAWANALAFFPAPVVRLPQTSGAYEWAYGETRVSRLLWRG